jgi:hypothetical protein
MKKIIIVIIGLIFIGFIGRCLYMVACISCTPSAIKKYEYSGTINQFESKLKTFAISNSDVTLKISYRDGGDKTNTTARDMMIELKNNSTDIVYHIAYIQRKPNEYTSIYLDDVYDKIHKSGGNDLDSSSVKPIFNNFKDNFLPRLNKADIILKPQFFYLY